MMMKRLLAALLICSAGQVGAQGACFPKDEIFSGLESEYGETVHMTGELPDGGFLMVLVNQVTGSWTAFFVSPDEALACPIAAGGGFYAMPAGLPV